TRAVNTGQRLVRAPARAPNRWRLVTTGRAPVRTFGQADAVPVRVQRAGRELLRLYQRDGVWELQLEGRAATLVTDTTGIRGRLLDQRFVSRAGAPVRASP
ncbi:MAG TPA: hypothetical protein VLH79_02960, partial [Chthonomonadales bacterium]|nr:hypothetical protein [Chthonomonadales bacterium]